MNIYNCGDIEIKNVQLLIKELEDIGEEFKLIDIQKSFLYLDKLSYEDIDFVMLNGFKEVETDKDKTITKFENCTFSLPLFNKFGYTDFNANISGLGKEIKYNNNISKEFEIKEVKIVKSE